MRYIQAQNPLVKNWLATYWQNARTQSCYTFNLCHHWLPWLGTRVTGDPIAFCVNGNLADVAAELIEFAEELSWQGLAPATRSLILVVVKTWFTWLHRMGHRRDDPTLPLTLPSVHWEQQHTPAWNSAECARLEKTLALLSAKRPLLAARNHAAYAFGRTMGLRGFETAALDWEDVSGPVLIFVGKGDKAATLGISEDVRDALARLRTLTNPSGPVFVSHRGQRMTRNELSHMIQRGSVAAGLEPGGFHTLRRSLATIALNELHIDPFEVMKLMRHSDIKMTLRYNQNRHSTLSIPLQIVRAA